MNGTDARATEHDHGGFGNHGHVYGHAVALPDAERFEDIREFADVGVQFLVGDVAHVIFRLTLPDNGRLAAARFKMTVEAVHSDIQFSISEPGMLDFASGGVPIEFPGMFWFGKPFQRLSLFQPEFFRLVNGALIQCIELSSVQERVLDDFG